MTKELRNYIIAMRKNAKTMRKILKDKSKKRKIKFRDPIAVYLIYNNECGACHSQFNYFMRKENGLNVTFKKGQNQVNKRRIVDRIYPIEINSKEYQSLYEKFNKLKDESGKMVKNLPSLDETPTPCFIDAQTKKFLGCGVQFNRGLKHITSQRKKF